MTDLIGRVFYDRISGDHFKVIRKGEDGCLEIFDGTYAEDVRHATDDADSWIDEPVLRKRLAAGELEDVTQ